MQRQLPVFPLNTVVFPGVTLPLHVFEDRYRALVHHLLTIAEKPDRVFGIVAIREGYEVGKHGVQSVHRVGCLVQMTSVEPQADGRFDIEVVGRQRLRLDGLDTSGAFLLGDVETVEEPPDTSAPALEEAERTRETFEEYRRRLSEMRGTERILAAWTSRQCAWNSSAVSAGLRRSRAVRRIMQASPFEGL